MIYGYGRVSTKGQAKDGNSLEAQERLLKEHGAEEIYMDSFTGTKMNRPEFNKLLELLQDGDTLVVAKLDRFARSVSQASDLITDLIDKGVRVDVCNLGVLDNSSMSTEPYKEQSTDDELERLKEYFIFNAMSQHPRNCYAVPRFLAVAKYLLKVICLFASELAQTNYLTGAFLLIYICLLHQR